MSKNNWKIDDITFKSIISNYGLIASGATLPLQSMYPEEFSSLGINQRNEVFNDFLGTIITRPDPNYLVFGFSYFDKKEQKDNEDIYVLNKQLSEIEFFPRGKYEIANPKYKNTHKDTKDLLRKDTMK